MLKKCLYLLIIISSISFSYETDDDYVKKFNFDKSKYENLEKNNINIKIYQNQQDFDIFNQMSTAKKMMQGSDYISKKEFNELELKINNIKNDIGEGPFSFLLYFTSSSVPTKTMMNILYSLSILQENGININSKQYLIGPPDNFQEYMYKMNDDLNKNFSSIITQEKIKRNYGLKIDPRYFEYFNIKEAPAMALATCPSITPNIETCEFHYFIKGDVSLLTFFDKISKEDNRYEKLTKILIANKIVDKEGN